jgi:hypothetical protein
LVARGARGTLPQEFKTPATALTFANVFTGAGPEAMQATIQTRLLPVPEPAAGMIASFAALTLAIFRRRNG